jgi:hypothetical protein
MDLTSMFFTRTCNEVGTQIKSRLSFLTNSARNFKYKTSNKRLVFILLPILFTAGIIVEPDPTPII